MDSIKKHLSVRLKHTFQQYIRHAIEHALSDKESENDILQVIINLQASLELLSKLYVLQREGWKGIVKSEFHNKSKSEIVSSIENGTIKTTPYWKNKDFISREIYLNDEDVALLDSFQNHRNQVMHLGVVNPSREILNEAIWFIVRIVHQLDWQDTLPMKDQYMSNSLQTLLGECLYNRLTTNSCYVDEAIDRAYELYPDDVKYCIQCGNESWALNDDDYRICLVCGYRCDKGAFGFIDCSSCHTKGSLVYDPLNIESNKHLNGKCCVCKEIIPVSLCPECGNVFKSSAGCSFCEK